MKPYDLWIANKYLEHIADEYTINLLGDKRTLDSITHDLGLNISMRELIVKDFKSRARQFSEYAHMKEHMTMLSNFVMEGKETLAIEAIQVKAKEMRQVMISKNMSNWRR